MNIDFETMTDDELNTIPGDELYDDLIDYMLDLGMNNEAIGLALNALESGDFERLENCVPTGTSEDEIDDMVSLYIDWAESDFIDDEIPDLAEAVLTLAQRRKRAMTMRRFKTKLKSARKRMAKRTAGTEVIQKRARRAAIKAVRSKVAGSRGADYANLTPGEKAVIDARVAKRKAAVDRLSKRMVTKVRQADRERLANRNKPKTDVKEGVDIATFTHPFKSIEPSFGVDEAESAKPLGQFADVTRSRWLPQFTLSGQGDRRYAMFKTNLDEDAKLAAALAESEIFNLMSLAEMKGVDVSEIVESVKMDLNESLQSDVKEAVRTILSTIAKKHNLQESLEAIAENRDAELVCESTGDSCMFVSGKQIKEFERLCDQLFAKFKIDFTFTKHFAERMSDSRNTPCLTLKELGAFVKKMYVDSGKKLKDNKDTEAVLKDLQSNINIPVAIEWDREKDEFDVILKTVMRKKDFKTPNKTVTYK